MHGDDRRDGHTLLLAAGERVRRAIEELVDAQMRGHVRHQSPDLVPWEAQLQRAEGELVAHVRAEELHVGVLEAVEIAQRPDHLLDGVAFAAGGDVDGEIWGGVVEGQQQAV